MITDYNREKAMSNGLPRYTIKMQVILNKNQKRQLVVELRQQGKTMCEIAQQIHMSLKDIASFIRQIDGSNDDDTNSECNNKSKDTKALYLLLIGKTPLEVARVRFAGISSIRNSTRILVT
jgi:hypothetical protein